ncbi:substrate-binding domain-containing protein [Streptomyces sp. SID89]|nr:substrate-binding domain-containing protein [Streptomyces sp. SID89]
MSGPFRVRRTLAASFLVPALGLAGCSLVSSSGKSHDGPLTIGFVNGGSTKFHTCLREAVEDAARNNLARIITADSHQDAARERSNVQDMIKRGVDVIILQTVNTQALQRDIAEAKSAGVPVFLTSVEADPDDILGAVVVDLKAVGKLDADWIGDDASGRDAEVGVIAGAPGPASDLLVDGFTEALPPTARVVDNRPGMFDAATAQRAAAAMIRAHPGLDYAFVANEEMAFAARKAFDAAGAHVRIVTVNGTDEALAALKDGRFAATVSNSAADTGALAVKNVISLMRHEKTEQIDHTPIRLITKENADTAPLYCPSRR